LKATLSAHLSEDEHIHVEVLVRRGKANARAHVLLKCDEGWSTDDIAETFGISEQTIRNVRHRFGVGGVEAQGLELLAKPN
jgi:DNA-directed RNA polymerase specialized sigma24 family protein